MKVKEESYQDVTAVLVERFWYNLTPGSFRFVGGTGCTVSWPGASTRRSPSCAR